MALWEAELRSVNNGVNKSSLYELRKALTIGEDAIAGC